MCSDLCASTSLPFSLLPSLSTYNCCNANVLFTWLQKTSDDIQAAVADYLSSAGQGIIATLNRLIEIRLAAALSGDSGVGEGKEATIAKQIMAAGGVRVQHVFPWLWAGSAVTAKLSLKGVATGELLSFQQSGLQVRSAE
jgi:hypothetical protein